MSGGSQAPDDLGHGPRLSQKEYERRIVELYSGLPPRPGKELQTQIRHRELDLTIDHRLGQNFPAARREALWKIQQRIEKKRLRLGLYWLTHFITYKWLYRRANQVAQFVIDEYAKVLTKVELQAYFGQEESEHPVLPPLDKL
jgi:hypothetical protein